MNENGVPSWKRVGEQQEERKGREGAGGRGEGNEAWERRRMRK